MMLRKKYASSPAAVIYWSGALRRVHGALHANLGADPWDVFHLGVAKQLGISFGTVIILTGAAVLLLWIPIRQMPGLGTVSNVIVLGLAADATLAVLPPLESMVARSALLVGAIVLNAIATGMYIGAGFGPGPRDGLMTGLHARTGWSLRGIRTAIELSVLLIGWLLGVNLASEPSSTRCRLGR